MCNMAMYGGVLLLRNYMHVFIHLGMDAVMSLFQTTGSQQHTATERYGPAL